MIDFASLDKAILDGLPDEGCQKIRQEHAAANLDYYLGCFEPYAYKIPPNRADDGRSTRYCLLTQSIVNKLTENLYRVSPARTLKDQPGATTFLERTYHQNNLFAKWQSADRQSLLNQVCAFQVGATGDFVAPLKIALWDASQLMVWLDPEDCTKVVAVKTHYDVAKRRYHRLWTPETVAEYESDASSYTAIKKTNEYPNPYGMLPFSFVHFNFPSADFWSGALGNTLRQINDNLNTLLTYLSDDIRYNLRPRMVAKNCDAKMEPNRPGLAGDILHISPNVLEEGANSLEADLYFLQSEPDYVSKAWEDLQNYLNLSLELAGIPESSIRMVQSKARSGVSIQSEQLPLIVWAKARQPYFALYEDQLARLVFAIGAISSRLGYQGFPIGDIQAAISNWQLTLRWSDLVHEVPGPGRNLEDEWLLRMGLTSKIQVLMRRNNLTRDEAIKALIAVVQDQKEEETISPGLSLLPDDQPVQGEGNESESTVPVEDTDSTEPQED